MKISVIMSVYNEKEEQLRAAVDSILRQTMEDFEFIIIIDNPNAANLRTILQAYAVSDKRINLIENDENIGLAKSLNKGIAVAKGEFIARMDADDISYPERFKIQSDFLMSNSEYDMVCSNVRYIDDLGAVIHKNSLSDKSYEIKIGLHKHLSAIVHSTVMIKRTKMQALSGYRYFEAAQDYDMWLRVLQSGGRIKYIPDVLLDYRIRLNSITKSKAYLQCLCHYYALRLFNNSKSIEDNVFSEEDKKAYFKSMGLYSEQKREKFGVAREMMIEGFSLLNKKKPKSVVLLLSAAMRDKMVCRLMYDSIVFHVKIKLQKYD